MTTKSPLTTLPHHRLIAYQVALEFAQLVAGIQVSDARLREQARKSTMSSVLNIAEASGRQSRADKSRVYAIALGELCEACAALELAAVFGSLPQAQLDRALALAVRLKDLLTRLIR